VICPATPLLAPFAGSGGLLLERLQGRLTFFFLHGGVGFGTIYRRPALQFSLFTMSLKLSSFSIQSIK
jgi:hypothetical protein